MEFLNLELGKYAFLSLIFLLLLYLIRPKLKEQTIPSLMFLMKDRNKSKLLAWFKKIIRDPLFLVQFFLLVVIAAACIEPIFMYKKDVTSANTVIVLDVSASMKANDRFKDAINFAIEKTQGRVSIVLAAQNPMVVLKDNTESKAKGFIKNIKPTDMQSNIGDALLVASDLLSGKEGKIVVISDFIDTKDANLEELKMFLENRGLFIEYIDVGKYAVNFGFTDYDKEGKRVFIKNFDGKEHTITIKTGDTTQNLVLRPRFVEAVAADFEKAGKIEITTKDDFDSDNVFYFSSPSDKKTKVMLVTNQDSSYLLTLLEKMKDVELEIVRPPIVPSIKSDIVIIHNIDKELLAVRFVKDLESFAKSGGNVIVIAQKDSKDIDYGEILPVKPGSLEGKTEIAVDAVNKFTKDISFGSLKQHFKAENKENVVSIASADDKSPLISYGGYGKGQLVYFGLIESESNMQFSPSYPLFWTNLFDFLTKKQSFSELNKKTGTLLTFNEKKRITTPTKELEQDSVMLEEIGIYKIDEEVISVNLLSEKESDINKEKIFEHNAINQKLKSSIIETEFRLYWWLAILSVFLVLIELLYIKVRGDI